VLQIHGRCAKELAAFSVEVRADLADAIARLEEGHSLGMPLSRPMPTVGKGVHELRLRDRAGIYRVIYFLPGARTIWLLHAFTKKTQATPARNIEIAKSRLEEVRP
jgi:phage-related protein